MKAASYVRVSTLEQKKNGYSIDGQKERIESYCKAMGYDLVQNFSDDGFSGSTTNRPALQKLLNTVKAHLVDIVIIYRLDRLSRDVRDTLNLVDFFAEHNVKLYSLSEQIDLSSAFGRASLTMSATFSAMEREVVVERLSSGKWDRVKNGEMLGMGKCGAPFGYKLLKEKKAFEIVPEEAEIVRDLFDLYVNQDFTIRKLYPYARAKYNHPFFKNPMCCRDILKRSMYAGFFTYGGELFKGKNFEPIIPYSLYLQAQDKMEKNRAGRQHDTSPYLLTGLLYCGECGNRYVGKRSKRYSALVNGGKNFHEDTYYGCAARIKRDRHYTPVKCTNLIYKSSALDSLIEPQIKQFNFQDFAVETVSENVFGNILEEISELENKNDKLLDLYLDEKITKDTFEKRSREIKDSIDKKKIILEDEKNKLIDKPLITINYLKEKQLNYDNLTQKEKRQFLRLLIKRIILQKNGEIIIKWRVK